MNLKKIVVGLMVFMSLGAAAFAGETNADSKSSDPTCQAITDAKGKSIGVSATGADGNPAPSASSTGKEVK